MPQLFEHLKRLGADFGRSGPEPSVFWQQVLRDHKSIQRKPLLMSRLAFRLLVLRSTCASAPERLVLRIAVPGNVCQHRQMAISPSPDSSLCPDESHFA